MGRPPRVPRQVVLTTDCGADMDDQWTLAHLALSPEVRLLGVIGGHAPTLPRPAAAFAVRTCRDVLRHLPALPVRLPLYVGASEPLASHATPIPGAGVDFLLRVSRRFNQNSRLSVLIIGAATDVASALLLDPGLARRIEIVAMGFDGPDGGDPWNVKNDPKAWQIVLNSDTPVTIGDARVTGRDLSLTPAQSRAMMADCGKAGRYLSGLHADWVRKHPDLTQGKQWPVWDEVTTAHLLGLTKAVPRPRPTMTGDMKLIYPTAGVKARASFEWVETIDAPALWRHFNQLLRREK